jgi:hypothetical protein
MGFDPARGRIIMFGGAYGGSFPMNDTWEWHSETNEWIQLNPAHIPPLTSFSPMAYDPAGQRLIVHTSGNPVSATWAWNSAASDWDQLKTKGAPPFRNTHAMVTDWGRATVVLYAGYPSSLNDTWEFDGSSNSWTQRAAGPDSRIYAMMAYDPGTARSYLFGGYGGELWSWDGNSGVWQFLAPAHRPGLNQAARMTFDHNRARAVLMGGSQNSGLFEWDGLEWSRHLPTVEPPRRDSFALVFDGTRTLLIGGRAMGQDLNDTWAWDGESWTPLNSENLTPRSNAKVSWDSQRNHVVLFGGSRQFVELTDTWEWDGTAWELAATTGPTLRVQYTAMAFDPVRAQTIAFIGGSDTQTTQTWAWSDRQWVQFQPAHHPAARSSHAMAWDDSLGAIILSGGYGPPILSDSWLWNGTDWNPIDTGPGAARMGHSLVFDSRRRQLLQVCGTGAEFGFRHDTMALGCRCPADCESSGIAPKLNVNDFICFLNRYAARKHDANCDHSTTPPVLDVNDFLCFSSLFAARCP